MADDEDYGGYLKSELMHMLARRDADVRILRYNLKNLQTRIAKLREENENLTRVIEGRFLEEGLKELEFLRTDRVDLQASLKKLMGEKNLLEETIRLDRNLRLRLVSESIDLRKRLNGIKLIAQDAIHEIEGEDEFSGTPESAVAYLIGLKNPEDRSTT